MVESSISHLCQGRALMSEIKLSKKQQGAQRLEVGVLHSRRQKKKIIIHCKLDYMGYSRMCVLANLNF